MSHARTEVTEAVQAATGPLAGVRVIEFGGIGPAPFCGMLLGDLGADVLLIDRPGKDELGLPPHRTQDLLHRNKRSAVLNLKAGGAIDAALDLCAEADILIEGFRPAVMERLGLGPEACWVRNPRLVYGRMTGWGQDGPLARTAGHDLNYISLVGALGAIGRSGAPPTPPLNLVGDNGGGALYLALGVLAALWEARTSHKGQVVDAAIVDGTASLMTMFYAFRQAGIWDRPRGENIVDSGAPYYDVYETRDGGFMSVAALEQKFFDALIAGLGIDPSSLPERTQPANWPLLRDLFAAAFRNKTRDEWAAIFQDSDACCAPVLGLEEAFAHPHNQARGVFERHGGMVQPRPAPRFSRSSATIRRAPSAKGADTAEALRDWGFTPDRLDGLRAQGAIA